MDGARAGVEYGSDDAIICVAIEHVRGLGGGVYRQEWEDAPSRRRPKSGAGAGDTSGAPPGPPSVPLARADPLPIGLTVCTTRNAAGPTTSIVRVWAPGDAARCGRCPEAECSAGAFDVCHIQVGAAIPIRSAAEFSLTTWRAGQGGAADRVDGLGGGAGA
jgi:hypothetical protein